MTRRTTDRGHVLVTGGCGFVGINLAHRLLSEGHRVVLFDDLSRDGVEKNLDWIQSVHGSKVEFERGDIRDASRVARVVRDAYQVFHFAAQVAVTTSLVDPIHDFEVNARGTLNLLEALRATGRRHHSSSRRPTRCTVVSPMSTCAMREAGTSRPIGTSGSWGSASSARSIFTAPTAARKVRPTSMSSTMHARTECRTSCSA